MKLTLTFLLIGMGCLALAQSETQSTSTDTTTNAHSLEIAGSILIRRNMSNEITQHFAGFNVQYVNKLNNRHSIALGTGLEYFNRGQNIEITQLPVYIQFRTRCFKEYLAQLDFKPGYCIPISGSYTSNDNRIVTYSHNDFVHSAFYEIGFSFRVTKQIRIRTLMRNQSTGVLYPTNERRNMYGLQLILIP